MGVKKYFIAVLVPEPLQARLSAIKHDLFARYGLKGALRSPAHITLHRPFEWKLQKEAALISKLQSFQCPAPFSVHILNFGFFEPRVIYAAVEPNAELDVLHQRLCGFAKRELQLFNEVDDLRGFHPHITLAFRDLKKPLFYELQPQFNHMQLEAAFLCEGFSLLRLEDTWEEIVRFLPHEK